MMMKYRTIATVDLDAWSIARDFENDKLINFILEIDAAVLEWEFTEKLMLRLLAETINNIKTPEDKTALLDKITKVVNP